MSVRGEVHASAAGWNFARVIARAHDSVNAYGQLAKLRLSSMVVMTAIVGYWLGSYGVVLSHFLWFTFGTLCIVAGANAFNQVLEKDSDARMQRTAKRPLPSGRISVLEATLVASVLAFAGAVILFLQSGYLTGVLGVIAIATYVLVYTPMKSRTAWSTIPGAIAGAIPPLMGWTAVQPGVTPFAWALFWILFFWQFPHTWAIAATYREQYQQAGYKAAPVEGTRLRTLVLTLALVVVSFVPVALGQTGTVYLVGAAALGLVVFAAAVRFGDGLLRRTALQLMVASLFYLPLLLALLAFDHRLV